MRLLKLSFLAVATVLAAGCSSTTTSSTDQLAAAVPDADGLSLEATGAASEDTTVSSDSSLPSDAGSPSGLEFLPVIRQGIHDLNAGVQQFFAPIAQLIATQGTDIVIGTSKSYGPLVQGSVTYLLTVKRFATSRYAWELQGKPSSAAASVAFTTLAVGTLFHADNDEIHRGRGQIGFDLDAFASVNPSFTGVGKLYVAYSNYDTSVPNGLAGDAKTLVYVLDNFSIDPSAHKIISAAFVGHKTLAGVRAARVLYYGEIPQLGGNTDLNELLLGRVRFNPGIGGRADALVAGGNIAPGSLIYGAECWDVSENLAWRKVWDCTTNPLMCTLASEQGNVMACAVGLQDDTYEAPTDAGSTTLEPGAPDPTVVPITAIPSFDDPS